LISLLRFDGPQTADFSIKFNTPQLVVAKRKSRPVGRRDRNIRLSSQRDIVASYKIVSRFYLPTGMGFVNESEFRLAKESRFRLWYPGPFRGAPAPGRRPLRFDGLFSFNTIQ
jgi:hypothetical protein